MPGFPIDGHICEIHGDAFNDQWMQEQESVGTLTGSSTVPEVQ